MRTWHKDLLPYLPRQHLLAQWRECCAIAKNISLDGIPNHMLVNKISKYPEEHFDLYTYLVISEFVRRGYKCKTERYYQYRAHTPMEIELETSELFTGWHNKRLLRQNMANLQEKYDCGGVTESEWKVLLDGYKKLTGEDYAL